MTVATRSNTPDTGRSEGYGVVLGDNMFRLATAPNRKVEVVTAPLEAPRVNTAASAEDVSNEFGSRFSRADFSGGEGLVYAHRADAQPNDARRYYDSQNVDIDDDGNVTLLHAPEVSDPLTSTGIRLAYTDGNLWATDGTNLRLTSDPEAASPTWGDDDPHDGETATTVADITTVGTTAYCAVSDGIHRKVSGGAWSHWRNRASIEHLWGAKGHLYASVGNVLYSYDTTATPTETTILTIAEGEVFNDLADAGSHIVVTASDGYVYALTDDGSTIALAGQTFLEGEEPWGIGAAWGTIIYGTRSGTDEGGYTGRLYTATIDANAVFENIDRKRVFENGTADRTPYDVTIIGDSAYVAVAESSTVSSMWRYDLQRAALHRSYRYDDSPTSRDVLSVAGRLYWGVDEVGVLHESGDYAASGFIVTPVGDLFTAQDKTWASIATSYSGLDSTGEKVTVKFTTSPSFSSYRRATAYTQGDRTSEVNLTGAKSRYLAIRIEFEPSTDLSTTPTLRSVSARAYPASDELIVRFPVDVSDQLSRPGKARTNLPGRGEAVLNALQELEGSNTTCEIPDVDEVLRGIVERVERPYTHTTLRGAQSVFAWVTFRGSRPPEPVSTEGLVLMGTYSNSMGLMATEPTMGDVA